MPLPTPFLLLALAAVSARSESDPMTIEFEKHVLDNGLRVILHEDRSDPVVAVFLYYHVGSSREEPGRSGFAHLFEHMLFQGSENVGDDQHFKLVQEAGGTLNGSTNQDRTNYFETLPSNQLELALWLESDRMGFLLPAMTQAKLDNQREVVKNERRQSYENRPYGMVYETLLANLYPPDHPYSWPTIGSMADLEAATLEDVSSFFRRWYGPNNATLAIGGDIDPAEALQLVERYFGSIPRGPEVSEPVPRPAPLEAPRRVVIEDRVALPQLTLAWPTVAEWHADEPALALLMDVLSGNKAAVLDRALMIDEELASHVTGSHAAGELAGAFTINVRPAEGVGLDVLERRVKELVAEVGAKGVDPETLERWKVRREGAIVRGLETVAARTATLAEYDCFRGDPGLLAADMARHRAVTPEDVRAAAMRYLVGHPHVALSVVPTGKTELAASGRDAGVAERGDAPDRSLAPEAGPRPEFRSPAVWHARLGNGVPVNGTPYGKIPLTRIAISVPAGRRMESLEHLGLATLTAEMLEEGTRRLSSTELVEELDGLGATLSVSADDDEISISASALNEHVPRLIGLIEEVLFEPRFAQEDFERLRRQRLVHIDTREDRIREIASDVYDALIFGDDSVLGHPASGTRASVERITLEDVRRFWTDHRGPAEARVSFVGSLPPADVVELLGGLSARWEDARPDTVAASFEREDALAAAPAMPSGVRVYLVDKPGAQQSELRIGHPGVSNRDEDYYPLQALNYVLGGSFSSRINLNLREDKGYTYGARSGFAGGLVPGPFTVSAAVHTAVTADAVREALKELRAIQEGVTAEELEFARKALVQALGRTFESTGARLGLLESIGKFGYPDDYPEERLRWLESASAEDLRALAREHLHPETLVVLVVGDRAEVREGLVGLDLGEVQELDPHGARLE
jgi:zinc protease